MSKMPASKKGGKGTSTATKKKKAANQWGGKLPQTSAASSTKKCGKQSPEENLASRGAHLTKDTEGAGEAASDNTD